MFIHFTRSRDVLADLNFSHGGPCHREGGGSGTNAINSVTSITNLTTQVLSDRHSQLTTHTHTTLQAQSQLTTHTHTHSLCKSTILTPCYSLLSTRLPLLLAHHISPAYLPTLSLGHFPREQPSRRAKTRGLPRNDLVRTRVVFDSIILHSQESESIHKQDLQV